MIPFPAADLGWKRLCGESFQHEGNMADSMSAWPWLKISVTKLKEPHNLACLQLVGPSWRSNDFEDCHLCPIKQVKTQKQFPSMMSHHNTYSILPMNLERVTGHMSQSAWRFTCLHRWRWIHRCRWTSGLWHGQWTRCLVIIDCKVMTWFPKSQFNDTVSNMKTHMVGCSYHKNP